MSSVRARIALLPALLLAACEPRRVLIGVPDTGGTFSVDGCPALHLSTDSLTWIDVSLDGSDDQAVLLANLCDSGQDLVVAIAMEPTSSSVFVPDLQETRLAPGATVEFQVSFRPEDLEEHTGRLLVASNSADDVLVAIALSGNAVADADDDGYDSLGAGGDDCDDRAPDVHPGAGEDGYDGIDNDCDGMVDLDDVTGAIGWFRGDDNDYLGYRDALSLGDLSGDGLLDVAAGGYLFGGSSFRGGVHVLGGEASAGWAGEILGFSQAWVTGAAEDNYAGAMGPFQEDIDGDGISDLFLVASDARYSSQGNRAGAVFFGPVEGDLSTGDADVTFTGSSSWYSTTGSSHLDLDGDGLADLLYGDWQESYYESGRVSGFLGASLVAGGEFSLSWDSDMLWTGANSGDSLGCALGGGDLDQDGYDDVLMSAPFGDLGGSGSGSVYLVGGAAEAPASGSIDECYQLQLYGSDDDHELGHLGAPQVIDIDGDDAMDIVAGSPSSGTVHVWLAAAALEGLVESDAADIHILGEGASHFGLTLAQGDLDGDGLAELVVGAPDGDDLSDQRDSSRPGEVYVFQGAELGTGTVGSGQAGLSVVGPAPGDLFGATIAVGDLSGSGVAELLVAAPRAGTDFQGWVWVFEGI